MISEQLKKFVFEDIAVSIIVLTFTFFFLIYKTALSQLGMGLILVSCTGLLAAIDIIAWLRLNIWADLAAENQEEVPLSYFIVDMEF